MKPAFANQKTHVGLPVILIISSLEYQGRIISETVTGSGLQSFTARVVGSGVRPVRRYAKDLGMTWKWPTAERERSGSHEASAAKVAEQERNPFE